MRGDEQGTTTLICFSSRVELKSIKLRSVMCMVLEMFYSQSAVC